MTYGITRISLLMTHIHVLHENSHDIHAHLHNHCYVVKWEYLRCLHRFHCICIMISAASLSVITNSAGGIIDDCIITRTGQQSFFIVSNAGRIKEDLEQMNVSYQKCRHCVLYLLSISQMMKSKFSDVSVTPLWDKSLLALQGKAIQGVNSVLHLGGRRELAFARMLWHFGNQLGNFIYTSPYNFAFL